MGYPQHIQVTVDAVVVSFRQDTLHVLLIQRKNDPFKAQWALPGGFVEDEEPLDSAVSRELEEETGVRIASLHQFHAFGQPGRDPRGRTISIAYLTLIDAQTFQPKAGTDAKEARWFALNALPELAFDHELIIKAALHALQAINASAIQQTQTSQKSFNRPDFTIVKDYLNQMSAME